MTSFAAPNTVHPNARLAAALLTALSTVLIYWLRDPGQFTAPEFWAEDGTVFWLQQYLSGWKAIAAQYNGYLHLAPRLVAGLASFFDPATAPRFYAYSAIALTVWSSVTVATCFENPLKGFLCGVALMAPPQASGEIWGTITNIQWFLAPALALIVATETPTARLSRVNRSVFAFVAGLSGPFSIFLSLPAAWSFWKRRDLPSLILCACGVVQALIVIFLFDPENGAVQQQSVHLASRAVIRLFPPFAVNIAAGIGLIGASLVIAKDRAIRLVVLWFALAVVVTATVKTRFNQGGFEAWYNGSRYFYGPDVALIWCAVSLLWSGRIAACLGAAWLGLNAVTYQTEYFERPPLGNTNWPGQIKDLGRRDLTIPIDPQGWVVYVPASRR
jgi:hypothetical protein